MKRGRGVRSTSPWINTEGEVHILKSRLRLRSSGNERKDKKSEGEGSGGAGGGVMRMMVTTMMMMRVRRIITKRHFEKEKKERYRDCD